MMKHLFLEGSVRTGKSTLIRNCLRSFGENHDNTLLTAENLGGFCSQRLVTDNGTVKAYRITEPTDLTLDIPYDADLSGVFALRRDFGAEKSPEVFETAGLDFLEDAESKKLILLDEIGGAELLCAPFRKRLYEILAGDVPCIGVLKLRDSAGFMSREAGYPAAVSQCNEQLRRDLIQKLGGAIIGCDDNAQRIIDDFLEEKLSQTLPDID